MLSVLFAVLVAPLAAASPPPLNDVILLLPPGVSYDLDSHLPDACFVWSSTNPEVVTVATPHDSAMRCASSAVVTASRAVSRREHAWVVAEARNGELIRVKVFVDLVRSLSIATTTHTMYREDFLGLSLFAYDAEGDLFSTLQGLHFDWSLDSHRNDDADVLVFKTLHAFSALFPKEPSHHKPSEGSAALVYANASGRASVTVTLTEPGYATVDPALLDILVYEPYSLVPYAPVFLAPETTLRYRLQTPDKAGVMQTIAMPSEHHAWRSTNATSVAVDKQLGVATALVVGSASVVVDDLTVRGNDASAFVHVVPPSYISVSYSRADADADDDGDFAAADPALSSWYLATNETYHVHVHAFDNEGNRLYDAAELRFKVAFEIQEASFSVLDSSSNQASHTLGTIASLPDGVDTVASSLKAALVDWPQVAPVTQPIFVTAPVRIVRHVLRSPTVLRLPVDPIGRTRHRFSLRATGGSHAYRWVSSNPGVVTVGEADGVVVAVAKGATTVFAMDRNNKLLRDSINVVVEPVASMAIVHSEVEAPVGDALPLWLNVLDAQGLAFDNCSALPISWNGVSGKPSSKPQPGAEPSAFSIDQEHTLARNAPEARHALPSAPAGCLALELKAVKRGHTSVQARYGPSVEAGAATIAAYNPLELVPFRQLEPLRSDDSLNVTDREAVLALGAEIDFVWRGGPRPWVLTPAHHRVTLAQDDNKDVATIERLPVAGDADADDDVFVYRARCMQLGEQVLTFTVTNDVSPSNPKPAVSRTVARISCQQPVSLQLRCRGLARCQPPRGCPTPPTNVPAVFAVATLPLPLHVIAIDAEHRPFLNVSSLLLEWAAPGEPAPAAERTSLASSRVLAFEQARTTVNASAHASGYDPVHTAGVSSSALSAARFGRIGAALEIHVVPPVRAISSVPPFVDEDGTAHGVSLINLASNNLTVVAQDGSGQVDFQIDNAAVLSKTESAKSRLGVAPKRPGESRLLVVDTCLPESPPARIDVRVSDVAALELVGRDKLQVGQTSDILAVGRDSAGNPFHHSQLAQLTLALAVDSDVVEHRVGGTDGAGLGDNSFAFYYGVSGAAVGSGFATASVKSRAGSKVSSAPKLIVVFPPLRVEPRALHLVPGAEYEVSVHGGPHRSVKVTFETEDASVATVNATGTVTAMRPGETTLWVKSQGYEGSKTVVVAQDSVKITVAFLTGIRIQTSTNNLLRGTEVSVRAQGLQGETPYAFGNANITFAWRLLSQNDDVLSLLPRYEHAAYRRVTVREEADFSVRVSARTAGRSGLAVTAEYTPPPHLQDAHALSRFDDSMELRVIEPLLLVSPASMLLTPRSSAKITTNKDQTKKLRYSVVGDGAGICEVDASGVVRVPGPTGVAFVRVDDTETESESLTVKIIVKPVHQLSIVPLSPVYYEIPVGTSASYAVVLRDDVGRQFHSAAGVGRVRVHTNHPDVLQVSGSGSSNETTAVVAGGEVFSVKGQRPGRGIVRVSLSDSEADVADFLTVRVDVALDPFNPVVRVGGAVRFTAPLSDGTERGKVWSSSDTAVVVIDAESGVATAKSAGVATIYFNTTHVVTHTQVTVVRVHRVEVDVEEGVFVAAGSQHKFAVALFDDRGDAIVPSDPESRIDNRVEIECSIREHWVATARAVYDPVRGGYGCAVTALVLSEAEAAEAQGLVAVTLVVGAGNGERKMQVTIPYRPPFVIVNQPAMIHLSGRQNNVALTVIGGGDIVVASSDPRILVEAVGGDEGVGRVVYEVRADRALREPLDDVTITFANRQQSERIALTFSPSNSPGKMELKKPSDGAAPAAAASSGDSILVTVLIGVFLIAWIWYVFGGGSGGAGAGGVATSTIHVGRSPMASSTPQQQYVSPSILRDRRDAFVRSPTSAFEPRGNRAAGVASPRQTWTR